MLRITLVTGVCAGVLCGGTALGRQAAQKKCDQARMTAWGKYVSCVNKVVARDAGFADNPGAGGFDEMAEFARCRRT